MVINLELLLSEIQEDLLFLEKEKNWILLKTILLCFIPCTILLCFGIFGLIAYILKPLSYILFDIIKDKRNILSWLILLLLMSLIILLISKGIFGFFSNITSIFISIKKSFWGDYNLDFKRVVIQKILSFINPTLTHFPLSQISEREFSYSYLLHSSEFNNIAGDDLIEGKINNTCIKLSEIEINYIDKGKKHYDVYKLWQGLFMIIDLPKNTNTAFGTSINISNNKILLDNTNFNKLFSVYAKNTTEAFYVLPSNLLERMVNFVHKTGRKFDFSVVDDKFYIAIPYNRELLEPPIFKSLFDYSIYEEYLTDLELAIGIVEDLKLA